MIIDLEMELVTTNRLTRALWLALKGIVADRDCHPSDDDMKAIEELAWHAHKSAERTENLFNGAGGTDHAK